MEKVKSLSFYFLTKHIIRRYFVFLVIAVAIIVNGFFISTTFAETTNITENILEDTHWSLINSPYVIDSQVTIISGATLYIDEGVVVKFMNGAGLVVEGKIEALGSVDLPVYFTSILDDSVGGDTNEDGDSTTPGMGDWDYIFINSGNEESILNNVIERYSAEGLIVYDSEHISSTNFNTDNGVVAFNADGSFSNLDSVFIELYEGSNIYVGDSSIINQDGYAIYVYNRSILTVHDSTIQGDNNNVINIYEDSSADFHNVEVLGDILQNTAISVFANSSLNFVNSLVSGVYNGFDVFDNSSLIINDSSIDSLNNGVSVYGNSFFDISGGDISSLYDGILLYDEVIANIDDSRITGAMDAGIVAYNNTESSSIVVTNSEITTNNYGFFVFNSLINVHQNSIHGNIINGAFTFTPVNLDFSSNYWGDKNGPTHITNPEGVGDAVSNNIIFVPFLEIDPLIKRNPVIIIPGITGSYLYKDYDDKGEIWPDISKLMSPLSISDLFLNDLVLNEDGTEKTEFPIKVGDIIRGILNVHVFDNLINKLQEEGYVEGSNLFVFPYDWRLSTKGTALLLNDEINKIISDTGQTQVDIISHSMGGLVAKKYIADYGQDKIDKLIFLGTPQLGSPKAFKVLMFGDSMGYEKLFLGLNQLRAKFISQNMPSVYELLPSSKYINENGNYVVNALDKDNSLNLNHIETKDFLVKEGRNSFMFPFAEELHESIDYLNLSGVRAYNFVGCAIPTIGKITVQKEKSWLGKILGEKQDYKLGYTTGDETVPLVSASKTIGSDVYYVRGVSHGGLPDSDSVMNGIISVLKNEGITFDNTLQDNNSNCKISGDIISTHSPVELHIYDEFGNHTGPDENGDIEYGIPNVGYDILEDINYVFLPYGNNYRVITKATNTGGFNLKIEEQDSDEVITKVHDWTLVPIESLSSSSEIWIGPDHLNDSYNLAVDNNGDGSVDENYEEGFDGTSIAEQATKDKDIKNKIYGSLIGSSFILKDNNSEDQNPIENIKISKLEDLKTKNTIISEKDNSIDNMSKDINTNLLASSGSIYNLNSKIKIQLIIVGVFALLILGLKFIFKVI